MFNTKKILFKILAIVLVLGLSACGNTANTSSKSMVSNNTETTNTISEAESKANSFTLSENSDSIINSDDGVV